MSYNSTQTNKQNLKQRSTAEAAWPLNTAGHTEAAGSKTNHSIKRSIISWLR